MSRVSDQIEAPSSAPIAAPPGAGRDDVWVPCTLFYLSTPSSQSWGSTCTSPPARSRSGRADRISHPKLAPRGYHPAQHKRRIPCRPIPFDSRASLYWPSSSPPASRRTCRARHAADRTHVRRVRPLHVRAPGRPARPESQPPGPGRPDRPPVRDAVGGAASDHQTLPGQHRPALWEKPYDRATDIVYRDGELVITQTPLNHRHIMSLLRQLRENPEGNKLSSKFGATRLPNKRFDNCAARGRRRLGRRRIQGQNRRELARIPGRRHRSRFAGHARPV